MRLLWCSVRCAKGDTSLRSLSAELHTSLLRASCFCQQADPNHRSQNGTATGAEQAGRVYGVLDSKNSGTSEGTVVLLTGQNNPNGIAWHNGSLYVAEMDRITRYDHADAHVIANMVRHASPLQDAPHLQAPQHNMLLACKTLPVDAWKPSHLTAIKQKCL